MVRSSIQLSRAAKLLNCLWNRANLLFFCHGNWLQDLSHDVHLHFFPRLLVHDLVGVAYHEHLIVRSQVVGLEGNADPG